jgi:hypothetical protein
MTEALRIRPASHASRPKLLSVCCWFACARWAVQRYGGARIRLLPPIEVCGCIWCGPRGHKERQREQNVSKGGKCIRLLLSSTSARRRCPDVASSHRCPWRPMDRILGPCRKSASAVEEGPRLRFSPTRCRTSPSRASPLQLGSACVDSGGAAACPIGGGQRSVTRAVMQQNAGRRTATRNRAAQSTAARLNRLVSGAISCRNYR